MEVIEPIFPSIQKNLIFPVVACGKKAKKFAKR